MLEKKPTGGPAAKRKRTRNSYAERAGSPRPGTAEGRSA